MGLCIEAACTLFIAGLLVHYDMAHHSITEATERQSRSRTLTEKGLSYMLETISDRRKSVGKRLYTTVTDLTNILETSNKDENITLHEFNHEYSRVLSLYEDFFCVHKKYQELLNEDQRLDDEEINFNEVNSLFLTFKKKAETFFNDMSVKPSDSVSQASHNTGKRSGCSRASGSCGASYISTAKLRDERKRAELEARARAFERERALSAERRKLEEAARNLKIEEQRLKISTEIEAIDAKSRVLDSVASKTSLVKSTRNSGIAPNVRKNSTVAQGLDPNAPSWPYDVKPMLYASNSLHNDKYDVNRSIMSLAHEMKKPVPIIKAFSGNAIEYTSFVRQFNARVCATTDSFDEKMNYLLQYTTGEAHNIVLGYSYLDAKLGFNAAMSELKDRYGDPEIIAHAYVKKALDWPNIKPESSKSLDEFAIFLRECQFAVENVNAARILEYSENIKLLLKKLPFYLHDRWRNIVFDTKDRGLCVKFSQFVDFVRREAKKANDPTYGRDQTGSNSKVKSKDTKGNFSKSFATQVSNTSADRKSVNNSAESNNKSKGVAFCTPCLFCKSESHILADCENIVGKMVKERYSFLKSKGLCFACLKSGHHREICKSKLVCSHCKRTHPTILHIAQRSPQESDKPVAATFTCDMGASKRNMLPIVPVRVKHKDSDNFIETYAFLDSGSTATFCTESLMNRLKVEGQKVKVTLHTMVKDSVQSCFVVKGLEVCGLDGENTVSLPPVLSQPHLPVSSSGIIKQSDLKNWPYLCNLKLPRIDSNVDLLIGVNVPKALEPWQVIPSQKDGPFAIKTLFGWVINGPVGSSKFESHLHESANRIDVSLRPSLDERLERYFNHDFSENVAHDEVMPSKEEKQFLSIAEQSIHLSEGHYVIDLPFRESDVSLPNNRVQAQQRLWLLRKRFFKDSSFHREYGDFMSKIMNKGYARQVSESSLNQNNGKVWYLPHHGVYHPQKKKLRVVFDCAARYQGVSLNDTLLQGPCLTNTLVGTLLRFRQESVAVMGDIDSMFYQVRIPEKHTSFLRFLWWQDGDINKPVSEYEMLVHLFGATSSPSVCNFALRKTALNASARFDKEVIDTVLNNFYVDDCLRSVESVQRAKSLVWDLKSVLGSGGFNISKWISNSKEVMESIPRCDWASTVKDLALDQDCLPTERALGVCWNAETDMFEFKISVQDKPFTRRGMLSVVSAIYDPLGFLAPAVLLGKSYLQESCRLKLSWDDRLPSQLETKWKHWLDQLGSLNGFQIPRCLKMGSFGEIKESVLHHFSDASEIGYGVVSYLRLVDSRDQIYVSLVMSKARVAPLKQVTIPRLELTAATVAVKVDALLRRELTMQISGSYFWTDSMAVIRYINNATSRFKTFVANRLAIIHGGSVVSQWRYVPSKLNPADVSSRGISADRFVKSRDWISGPTFLKSSEKDWPCCHLEKDLQDADIEVKKDQGSNFISVNQIGTSHDHPLDALINYHSSWNSLKRSVAWILCCKSLLLNRIRRKGVKTRSTSQSVGLLSTEHLQDAENCIVRYCQSKSYSCEISQLKTGRYVNSSSSIRKLDPYYEDGLIRVGGRLNKSSMPELCKSPIILPKVSPVSKMIIEQVHRDVGHMGRNSILSRLRQKFWVVHAPSLIRKVLSACVLCRKIKGKACSQKMADLPIERVMPDNPPFTNVGMDDFGPIEVKQKRSRVKRYGVVFTCLSTRAIHLEVAESLDTSSCINALRRFIARRGQCSKIISDNGTNLVGAKRELRKCINEWNNSQIHNFLCQKNVSWHFNPPAASHFGGIWERMIRTVRQVLYSILREQVLNDENLRTLLCEVEFIINDRPISKLPDCPNDLEALTPNHLLLLNRKPALPPGVFSKSESYAVRRWRQVQYLANLFWKRWIKEYLPLLQERRKWHQSKGNLSTGDIVLVVDEKSPRGSWPLGRITKTFPDKLGNVRRVYVQTQSNELERPVHKLCLISESNDAYV